MKLVLQAIERDANRQVAEAGIRSGRFPRPPIMLDPETQRRIMNGAIVGAPAMED